MSAPPVTDPDIYTVTRLNRQARLLLEGALGSVWVQGEISNLSKPASGHWYFSLKDAQAQLRCAMFRQRNALTRCVPREGQQVLVRGRISLYEPRGDYQLLVEVMEDTGVGALQRAYEELRARLAAEGLFAAELKRPLPKAPPCIGVITSPTGAAIRDILHVLAARFPAAEVIIYPVPVQGAAAAPAIVAALDLAGAREECAVLILARCALPVVTGIGHETDVTIADFIADVRAPTPTAAAQMVVPDRRVWLQNFAALAARFVAAARRALHDADRRVQTLNARLQRAHPGAQLQQHVQRLDELDARLRRAWRTHLTTSTSRLELLMRALHTVSPLATLERGFAIVTRAADGTLIRSRRDLPPGTAIEARLADGVILAQVTGARE